MLFSVLIPAYNAEKFLKNSIDSIFAQDENDYEIVLVDDCSLDETGKICDEYATKYPSKIRTYHHNENKGLLLTRRTLFSKANGEWFISVDADDTLEPGALTKLKYIIENNKCDMILYDMTCYKPDGTYEVIDLPLKDGKVYSGDNKKEIYKQRFNGINVNSICTKAIHRSVIDYDKDYTDCGFVRIGTDIFQSMLLFDRATSIYYLHESLYRYIKTDNSITAKLRPNIYRQRKALWDQDDFYLTKWGFTEDEIDVLRVGRVKTMLNYINRYASQDRKQRSIKGKTNLQNYLSDIQNEEYFKRQYHLSKSKLGIRYRIKANLLISQRNKMLKFFVAFEDIILSFV